jgi:glycosyltransferase involved in cell wall biosynthesis
MKISFLATDIRNSAGTERVTVNLCNHFASEGHEVAIYSLSSGSGVPFFDLDERVKLVHLGLAGYHEDKNRLSRLGKKVANTLKARAAIRRMKADILVGTGKHLNIYLVLFATPGIEVIGCEHFAHNVSMSPLVRRVRDSLYRKLKKLVVLTEYDRLYYSGKGIDTVVCPNGITHFPEGPSVLSQRRVLAVGRHTNQKQFDKLIRIWSKVRPGFPDWRLRVVGDGPLFDYCRGLSEELMVKDSVEFLPATKEIEREYLAASIYAMTSKYEAFPMVLLEAMSFGIPCVSFDCDTGPRDIIRNGEDGFLVPMDSEDEFCGKLSALMGKGDMRIEMGAAARRNIRRYNFESWVNKWDMILNGTI